MTAPAIGFRVLGPLQVDTWGQPVAFSSPSQRLILGVLLCHPGRAFSVDALAEALWEKRTPPASARSNIRLYIHRLRRALGDKAVIERRSVGYALIATDDQIDSRRFERLVHDGQSAQASSDLSEAYGNLGEALALWRGPPFTDLPDTSILREEASRLDELRLRAIESHNDVRLQLGRHEELLPELHQLMAQHPLRERLRAQLMLTLYRCGRQTEALGVYQAGRGLLLEEFGLEPCPDLQELQRDILNHEERLALHPPALTAYGRSAPETLPLEVRGFAGRVSEMRQLDSVAAGSGKTVVISALSGTAGVGKTALAVHWAHGAAARFPDGQLYVNLRGFDPVGEPMSPSDAVRGFLFALAVLPDHIPADFDAQVGLYRSMLAASRTLVVLDNARDAQQVRPLLPGAPGCMVVITSRNCLTGLVVGEGAHPLTLDLLSPQEARQMLVERLGAARVAADPQAVEEVIRLTARLPLALAIVAACVATQPEVPMGVLAAQLRGERAGLDAFTVDDPEVDMRSVFSWSYRTLGGPAARMFRLLALHPGPDIGAGAAASLAGVTGARAHEMLAELSQNHLVTESTPGRYGLHDLLRIYAAEKAQTDETEPERQAAIRRMSDHYLHTAYACSGYLEPNRYPVTLATPEPGVTVADIHARAQALAWFEAEHRVLLAVARLAKGHYAWEFAWTLVTYFDRQCHWQDWVDTQHLALVAAQRESNVEQRADAHRYLGYAYTKLRRFAEAREHHQRALRLQARVGNIVKLAQSHMGLSAIADRSGHHAEALDHARQALELFRQAGNDVGTARALNTVGWHLAQLGELPEALRNCEAALDLHLHLDNQNGAAHTWDSLGFIHLHLGGYDRSIECYQRAIELFRAAGNRYNVAEALDFLGDAEHASGDEASARQTWKRAIQILQEIAHPWAQRIEAKLARPPAAGQATQNFLPSSPLMTTGGRPRPGWSPRV